MPIVQARALELAVVKGKAQGADEVERGTRCGTGARDIARVLRNFGLVQYNVDLAHAIKGPSKGSFFYMIAYFLNFCKRIF
jgi:hypothetical protein